MPKIDLGAQAEQVRARPYQIEAHRPLEQGACGGLKHVPIVVVFGAAQHRDEHFVVVGNQLVLDSPAADADQLQYSVRLRVADRAGSFYDENLVFSLPTSILSTTTGFDETLAVGSTVSELSITGYDDSTAVKFSLVDQSHDLFSISGNQLILAREADYEDHSFHDVTLQALLDSGEAVLRQIRFQVSDQNDAPHGLDVCTTLVEENAARGTTVARLTGSDQDAGDR